MNAMMSALFVDATRAQHERRLEAARFARRNARRSSMRRALLRR